MDHPFFDTACIAFACVVPVLIWWLIPAGINEWNDYFEGKRQRQLNEKADAEVIKARFHTIQGERRRIPGQRSS